MPKPLPKTSEAAVWAQRVQALAADLRTGHDDRLGELWLSLNVKLHNHLRAQAARQGGIPTEDLEDIAAEKSLDLIRKIDSGNWKPDQASLGEVINYVTRVAHNGLADHYRRRRVVSLKGAGEVDMERVAPGPAAPPPAKWKGRRFGEALVSCAEALAPAHRTAWILRVFHDLATRDIAAHPEVQLTPGNVDVILGRCRKRIRECMESKGLAPGDMPPGAFTEVWAAFRAAAGAEGSEHE